MPTNLFVAGYNAYVLKNTAFDCPFKDKVRMLLWLSGYAAAKRKRAYNCI